MTTIFLHIGRGKTGTTVIQRFLAERRKELADVGVLYPKAGEHGSGHQSFAKSLLREAPNWMDADPETSSAQETLRAELKHNTADRILFSSENFTLVDPQDVQDFFSSALGNCDVRIIFFARTQDEVVESQYNQDVKWCLETATFEEYIASGRCDELDYSGLLAPRAQVFGREHILARVYHSNTLISDFCRCIGPTFSQQSNDDLDRYRPDDDSYANASLGYHAVMVLRALNQFDIPDRRAAYSEAVASLRACDVLPIFFSAKQASDFRDRYRASNLRFSEAYLERRQEELGGRRYSDEVRDAIDRRLA
jgi:hypothetical protein